MVFACTSFTNHISNPLFLSKPETDILDSADGLPAKIGKRQRPQSLENANEDGTQGRPPLDSNTQEAPKTAVNKDSKNSKAAKKADAHSSSNQLLPAFKDTYSSFARPSLINQISRWFPFTMTAGTPTHLNLASKSPRISKAIIIGVHGYFPAPLVRSLLGQPTGTSIRFANGAANAISKWTEEKGYTCEIEKVALEGEGKIRERVEVLWNLLLNWVDKIRKADFVLIACHSQGCPVALMLLAKLIGFGCVTSARVGVCAMAGINQGPFIDYRTRWIGATALELFEFARQDSKVSLDYAEALDVALKFGVKILYVGSIDDQYVHTLSDHIDGVTCIVLFSLRVIVRLLDGVD